MLLNACQTTKETKVNEEPIEVIKKELKTNIDLGLTDNNYTVSYDKEIFGEIDTSATDNSLFIKCLIDKEHMHENYIDVQYEDKYSADKLFDGLVLQSKKDNVYTEELLFGKQRIPCKYLSYFVADRFMISYYIIEHNEGAYLIEVGNYIYPEDNPLGPKIAGYMEEVINNIKVSIK